MSDETIEILHETRKNLNAGKVVFKRFELLRELGSGGMGVVWLAKDLEVEGRVALKFLPGLVRDPVAERDLRDEVKNARDLVHENIVSVRTLHKDDASIAVEMEYVDGPNVNALIANSPNRFLEVDEAAPIVRGLCLAIDHAWSPPRRLVHRDIKPHNLLVNSAHQVKVVDFGIAHTVSETITRLTGRTGNERERVVGTLPYMSPQQLKGEVHHSNDIYSIGATIYQMLTGVPPFRATDTTMLMRQIEDDTAPPMAERRKQVATQAHRSIKDAQPIPKVWEETVRACLSKIPAKRPASAREIAIRLGLVEGRVEKRSSRWVLPVGLTAAVLLAGGAAWTFRDRFMPPANPEVRPAVPAEPITKPDNKPVNQPTTPDTRPAVENKTPAPATPQVVNPPAPAVPAGPRQAWKLLAAEPVNVSIFTLPENKLVFEGALKPGDQQALPVETTLLLQAKDAKGLQFEIDGKPVPVADVPSHRWLVALPADPTKSLSIKEAPPPPPPFEKEVGPLVAAGQVNQIESDWLRAALGGEKGAQEQALVKQLFSADSPLTLQQWRARTSLQFKPDEAALTATAPKLLVHAIDLTLLPGGAQMRLLRLEAGRFQHGSPTDEIGRRPSDQTKGPASIAKPFFIGIYEVTQAQYEAVMPRSPSYWRGNPTWPIDQVTWNAIEGEDGFLARVNATLAKEYGGVIVADLPTDDEWEYACRAGTTTAFNNGQDITKIETDPALKDIAYYNRAEGGPRPVGSFAPNAWGLYDMHGNIQEWTRDRFVRGGSWESRAANCRAASRIQMSREAGPSNQTGFRLVLRIRER